jgi:hypothetical protein
MQNRNYQSPKQHTLTTALLSSLYMKKNMVEVIDYLEKIKYAKYSSQSDAKMVDFHNNSNLLIR